MKTIKEWLKQYLTKEEYKKAEKYEDDIWKEEAISFFDALTSAFMWPIEDHDYWDEISKRITKFKL